MLWLEIVGWAGSAVLVYSLMQTRVLRFRALNLCASLVLTGYNAAIGVWPMVAVNLVIAAINVVHIVRLVRTRDDAATYEVVEVRPDDAYLLHVMRKHAADVERHNPGFAWDGGRPGASAFLVVRETETVGVVLIAPDDADPATGRVELDYVLPRFRDFSVGKFVYRRGGLLSRQGFGRLVATTRMADARDYFPRVGFHADGERLVLDLSA